MPHENPKTKQEENIKAYRYERQTRSKTCSFPWDWTRKTPKPFHVELHTIEMARTSQSKKSSRLDWEMRKCEFSKSYGWDRRKEGRKGGRTRIATQMVITSLETDLFPAPNLRIVFALFFFSYWFALVVGFWSFLPQQFLHQPLYFSPTNWFFLLFSVFQQVKRINKLNKFS